MTHELVNEKLAIVVLRKWSGRAAEVVAGEYRTCRRGSSPGTDDREIGRCCVRIPDESTACRRQLVQAGVVGRAVDRMRRIALLSGDHRSRVDERRLVIRPV